MKRKFKFKKKRLIHFRLIPRLIFFVRFVNEYFNFSSYKHVFLKTIVSTLFAFQLTNICFIFCHKFQNYIQSILKIWKFDIIFKHFKTRQEEMNFRVTKKHFINLNLILFNDYILNDSLKIIFRIIIDNSFILSLIVELIKLIE